MIDDLLSTIEHIDGQTRKVIVAGDIAITSATCGRGWPAQTAGRARG